MNAEEFDEFLRHSRLMLRTSGWADVDGLLTETRLNGPTAQLRTLNYLEGLADELRLGTDESMRELMRRLRAFPTDDGGVVSGITIDLVGSDAEIYGEDEIDLVGSTALAAVLRDLEDLIRDLREEG